MKKYIVTCCGNDYDCGVPYACVVDKHAYNTFDEAFDALVKAFMKAADVENEEDFNECIDSSEFDDGGWPAKNGHGKYGFGFYITCDGTTCYDIQEIEI